MAVHYNEGKSESLCRHARYVLARELPPEIAAENVTRLVVCCHRKTGHDGLHGVTYAVACDDGNGGQRPLGLFAFQWDDIVPYEPNPLLGLPIA